MDASKLNWDKITFATACREDTGVSMCDSGGESGRSWQQPELAEGLPRVRDWHKGCSATIEASVFLDAAFEIRRDWQREWQEWDGEQSGLDWFESGQGFMASKGYRSVARGNTYNNENDLSQCYVWDVFVPEHKHVSDWIYEHDAVVLIHVHTGADARSGYGRPVFCKSRLYDYVIPMDLCAEYRAEPVATPLEINDVDWGHYQAIDEKWQTGWSSYPYGRLEEDVETWHEETRTRDSVEVTLKTGERVRVRADTPYMEG